MNYLNLTPKQFCDATDACDNGYVFAITCQTMTEVWDKCPRPDWLLWILDKLDRQADDRTLRLFAVWCVRNTPLSDGRKTGDVLTDPRSLAALEVVERYAHGNATDKELAAARAVAWDAARAAAWDAATDAARAAARAAAWDAAWAAQADQLRKMIPNPFAMEEGAA